MNVKLVSLTKSVIQTESGSLLEMSSEELIVYTARVSNPANQLNFDTAEKLILFMVQNKHWSPFEMVDMTVEITTSRGIAQQILRHRSFSFQEFSQRYAKVNNMEPVQLRYQASKNRQSSTDTLNEEDNEYLNLRVEQVISLCKEVYGELLDRNVAKECARFVLPITTQTRMYMKGSVRSWIHYLQVRCDPHAQLEHQQVAFAIRDIFRAVFPDITKALSL